MSTPPSLSITPSQLMVILQTTNVQKITVNRRRLDQRFKLISSRSTDTVHYDYLRLLTFSSVSTTTRAQLKEIVIYGYIT